MAVSRNDPCPCGSGRKYKQCCLNAAPKAHPQQVSGATWLQKARERYTAGDFKQAEAACLEVIKVQPGQVDALFLLGGIALAAQNYARAEQLFTSLLNKNSASSQLHQALASALMAQGKLEAATVQLQKVLQHDPGLITAQSTLAGLWLARGDWSQAEVCYRRILQINPTHQDALVGLGMVYKQQGQLANWLACWKKITETQPGDLAAYHTLGRLALAAAHYDVAESMFREAVAHAPEDWKSASSILYVQNYQPDMSPKDRLAEARRWGQYISDWEHRHWGPAHQSWDVDPAPARLRVGLVSGDLRQHPVGFFLEGMLEYIDPCRLELFAYVSWPEADALTERLKSNFSAWVPVHDLDDAQLVQRIRSDHIHVLIDLSGHTKHTRLPAFAGRPAPVQVAWLGYFGTTGLPEMDYILVDEYVSPSSEPSQFSEQRWWLDQTYRCFSAPHEEVPVSPLPALEKGYVTLGCFNHISKLNVRALQLWGRILQAIPNARLWLKTGAFDDPQEVESYQRYLVSCGLDTQRVIFQGGSPRQQYLECFHHIDFALDPFPFTGGTVSVEGLWMGVPVLTLKGQDFLSRSGENLLYNLDLASWVARDVDDYLAQARYWSEHLTELATLRADLRHRLQYSPLLDGKKFAQRWQDALWAIWERRQASLT
ncbi:MAG: tetratricopeptide repeat protein [Pseudomonadales bacterium]|nr:tetratricopeptide repeat protein [Pseudomonadales bacterium]